MSQPIEWYRQSPIKKFLVVATVTFSIMMTGVFMLAFGLDNSGRVPLEWQPWCLTLGICIVIIGVSLACLGFFIVLSKDGISLQLQSNGLRYKSDQIEHFYKWQKIETIDFSSGKLRLKIEGEKTISIKQSFLGISGPKLAQRLQEFQRLALLGTIK
jgi:hypothetical protein